MPPHTIKHICNSHKPTPKPKIAKELAYFLSLFCRPEKQNQVSAKIENEVVLMKENKPQPLIIKVLMACNAESEQNVDEIGSK